MTSPDPVARHYHFLTACRNEASIIGEFLDEFREAVLCAGIAGRATLHVVDDLSFDGTRAQLEARSTTEDTFAIRVIKAPTNLGNQGAMFFGLQQLEIGPADLLLTLDCDGEDDVHEIPSVLALGRETPEHLVLIERGRRSESLTFKLFFGIYKLLFRALTRRRVVPNNFMLIPGRYVPAIARIPLASVHFAYAVYKLNAPFVAITRDRRVRYGGKSSQNLFMLVSHGLVGLMVFYEVVIAKLFVFLALFCASTVGLVLLGAFQPAPEPWIPQTLLLWSAIGLACSAVAALSLLVSSALVFMFKAWQLSMSIGSRGTMRADPSVGVASAEQTSEAVTGSHPSADRPAPSS